MKKIFPGVLMLLAVCLLAAAPRSLRAQTSDSLPATARAATAGTGDNEEALRLAQREIAEAQREVLQAQREVQREVASAQREAMAVQRQAALSAQREVMQAQREAIAAQRDLAINQREVVRSQSLALRQAAMAQREAAMALRETHLEETRKMIDQMVRDRLIDRNGEVHIEFRDEHLYINGKEQPKDVYDKYKSFFHQNNQDIRLNLGDGIAI